MWVCYVVWCGWVLMLIRVMVIWLVCLEMDGEFELVGVVGFVDVYGVDVVG